MSYLSNWDEFKRNSPYCDLMHMHDRMMQQGINIIAGGRGGGRMY